MYRAEEGITGETLAKEFLVKKGYRIFACNYNAPGVGELDIIAKDGNTLVFVEVRSRSSLAFGHPFDTVNTAKRKKTVRAAEYYLMKEKTAYSDVRFDIIAVIGGQIEHLEDAFYGKMLR